MVKRAYRYVNDHGEVFRMTESRYRQYLLAGTCDWAGVGASKVPHASEYGKFVCVVVTVTNFTPTEFSDQFNVDARPEMLAHEQRVLSVKCPTCEAEIGMHCQRMGKRYEHVYFRGNGASTRDSQRKVPHEGRARAAERAAQVG